MNILVINCGSSSLKYQLINMSNEEVLAKGLVERIGIEGSILTQKVNGEKYIIEEPMANHTVAIKLVLNALVDETHGVIKSMDEISAVGHRVVHGGEKYSTSVIVNDDVMKEIEECVKLAPLHNPANIIGINACKELMPKTPMVVVFDTAFHQTMPEEAYMYAIPYELYKNNQVRKYGFHGTSHKYVSEKVAEIMGKDIKDLKIVTCHLGNGSSCCAIDGGKSVDTSMGFTPLEGLVMGTRSGNLDPAVVTYIMKELDCSIEEVNNILNKKSGILGLSGISSDFRDIKKAAKEGHHRAKLSLDMFSYRVRQYIGSYAASMNGLDCIVFTAGIGENDNVSRGLICEELGFLGVDFDKEKNDLAIGETSEITKPGSKVKVFVIPTNEELMIAKDTLALISK